MKNALTLIIVLLVPFLRAFSQRVPIIRAQSSMNVSYGTSYNFLGNAISKNVSYYNALGELRQSQSWDKRTNKIWISESLYDEARRPLANSFSFPKTFSGGLTQSFIFDTTFLSKNCNFCNTIDIVGGITASEDLLNYYGENNISNRYKDITSYPFSIYQYSTLNPGDILNTLGGNKVIYNNQEKFANTYSFTIPAGNELRGEKAFNDITLNTQGFKKTVSIDLHGIENVIFSDVEGNILASARSGNEENTTATNNDYKNTIQFTPVGFLDIHIPKGLSVSERKLEILRTTNKVKGVIKVYSLIDERLITIHNIAITKTISLKPGIYRLYFVKSTSHANNSVSVSYKENYYDYAINEYDEANRLKSVQQPLNKLETTYEYNSLGQLDEIESVDEGKAKFRYRNDGQIRFSQNSLQKNKVPEEFSYTNYDNLGRPVESGIVVSTLFDAYNVDNDNTPAGTIKEKNITFYDLPDQQGIENAFNSDQFQRSQSIKDKYLHQQFVAGNVSKTSVLSPSINQTWYSYDIQGRVSWILQDIEDLGMVTIDYKYDFTTGQIAKIYYQKGFTAQQFIHRYTYNITGNLKKVETSIDDIIFTEDAEYFYVETGELMRTEIAENLQGIDYIYNLNGQLKAINHPSLNKNNDPGKDGVSNGFKEDVFGMSIEYNQNDYLRSNTPTPVKLEHQVVGNDLINGNIKAIRWNNKAANNDFSLQEQAYVYSYNKNNWITEAEYIKFRDIDSDGIEPMVVLNAPLPVSTSVIEATNAIVLTNGFSHTATASNNSLTFSIVKNAGITNTKGDYKVSNITYDANGNILSLKRNKNTDNDGNELDNLIYHYHTSKPNQLRRVEDQVMNGSGGSDIKNQTIDNYAYNDIGQLIYDFEHVNPRDAFNHLTHFWNDTTTPVAQKAVPNNTIIYSYNASGLVTQVEKKGQELVKFYYNDRGQRVKKESIKDNFLTKTIYVRDALGIPLATYSINDFSSSPTLDEHTIYGVSRLGVYKRNSRKTSYEITDHLGNVRAVVAKNNARLLGTDYYPGGMPMPSRDVNGDYRYGFQGQELDKETGKPAFELRLYDPRIMRWLTTDPANQYASPYMAMGNNWVNRVDPDGGEDNPVYGSDGTYKGNTKEGFTGEAIIYDGNKDFSNLSKEQLTSSSYGGTFLSSFNFSDIAIRDNIESHIVNYKLPDGLNISNNITIENGRTSRGGLYEANVRSDKFTVVRGVKNGSSIADEYFEPTVENLRSIINLHEIKGHIIGDLTGSTKDHFLIFKSQVDHKKFHTTTSRFKAFHLSQLYDHGDNQGINILNNTRYSKLFYQKGGAYDTYYK